MPKIYLLISDNAARDRLAGVIRELMPQLDLHMPDISIFPEKIRINNEISVFIVEAGNPDFDYSDIGEALKLYSKDCGVSVLALDPGEKGGTGRYMEILNPDGLLELPCKDIEIVTQIEYLTKISELRAMNLNLGEQLGHRVSRLAGLEQKLRHTNWILEALNRCGEVIIKAANEEDMLGDLCSILASSLQPCLVLVGYAEMDAGSSVKVVAAKGDKADMSKELSLTWDTGPRGQGPTGSAIRTGKRVYIRNPVNDSSVEPWKDIFEANGIKYIIALPISYAGVGFGALTIYGAGSAVFSDDDLDHLQRVAENTGYGIWFLRHRQKRKLVEEELQKTNELFSLAMEATEDALWDWNVSTGKAYFSPRWFTMLGYEPNELPMDFESFTKIVHPDDLEKVNNELEGFMEKSVNYSLEFRALAKDGDVRWILARGKVVKRDNGGKPLRIVGTHVDITRRKEMEQQLGDARSKAESANKAKDRFLEAMSHELRTPLNGIMSILQTLTEADLKESEKEYIQMALDSSRQLLVSINKILELSSLQKGIRCIYTQPFDLEEEMKKITEFFMPMARNKKLDFNFEVQSSLPDSFIGDISIIRQIIWNLLENAIKYTSEGKVLLKVSRFESKDNSSGPDSWPLVFEVIDTGKGISGELQDKLFEPFGIIDDDLGKKRSPHGIGLSVCKQLADTIGARIGVESQEGKGSRFYLIVDLLVQALEEPETQDAAHRRPSLKTRRIMVVEDEKVNLMLIERMLKASGFDVLTAADGQEALEVFMANPDISLVLMDIMVPKYDGFELTAMIREGKFSGLKNVPIVAVTALADSDSRQKCFDYGMNAYLPKPIDNQDLMGMVSKYVDAPQLS